MQIAEAAGCDNSKPCRLELPANTVAQASAGTHLPTRVCEGRTKHLLPREIATHAARRRRNRSEFCRNLLFFIAALISPDIGASPLMHVMKDRLEALSCGNSAEIPLPRDEKAFPAAVPKDPPIDLSRRAGERRIKERAVTSL